MEIAQTLVGFAYLLCVVAYSIYSARQANNDWVWPAVKNVAVTYVFTLCIGGFIWLIAWLGILLRTAVQWLIKATAMPAMLLLQLFS